MKTIYIMVKKELFYRYFSFFPKRIIIIFLFLRFNISFNESCSCIYLKRTQGGAGSSSTSSVSNGCRHTRPAPARATGAFGTRVQRCTRGISCACWNVILRKIIENALKWHVIGHCYYIFISRKSIPIVFPIRVMCFQNVLFCHFTNIH